MNVETIPDIEVIEHLDFDHGLPCEGIYHPSGVEGHAGAAAYWQSGGCAHMEGLRCAGYVHRSLTNRINCAFCRVVYEPGVVTWRPITPGT